MQRLLNSVAAFASQYLNRARKAMLENVFDREELVGHARARARDVHAKSVNNKLVDEAIGQGWTTKRKGKTFSSIAFAPHDEKEFGNLPTMVARCRDY